MSHLTHDELVRWRDEAPAHARGRVITHLASCGVCSARYATVVREAPLKTAPALAAGPFLAVGRRAVDRARRPTRRWWWLLAPLAAAAVWVLTVVVPRQDAPSTVLRGRPEFSALSPAGSTPEAQLEFRWVASGAWTRFRVEVFDASSQVVWTARSNGAPVPADGALLARLRDRSQYRWTVTALDARGQATASSPLMPFRLAP